MVEKNQTYVVDIIDYGSNGEGVAKINGQTVFVPFALVGEKVEIIIVKVQKDYAFGKLVNIIKESTKRVESPCPYFTKCGGCQLQHINYQTQLEIKKQFVENCIKKYAKIDCNVENCVASDKEYRYRNKFSFPIQEENGEICVGMYRVASHKFVKIDDCLLQMEAKEIIDCFLDYANKFHLKAYNSETKSGLRHIVCRIFGKNIYLTIVSTQKMQNLDYLYKKLTKFYNQVNISVNINTSTGNAIMGDKNYVIYGDKLVINEYDLTYDVDNYSFMQVNDIVKHKLYDEILDNISAEENVIDAYSGAGVLSAIMAQKCKTVYGIEIVKSAVESANRLADINKIKNLQNIYGDCAIELPKLSKKLKSFSVVLDPPRKGCDRRVLDALNSSLPRKIIYVSCNPATLARDLYELKANYNIVKILPFDMFPQTANVETLVVLENNIK